VVFLQYPSSLACLAVFFQSVLSFFKCVCIDFPFFTSKFLITGVGYSPPSHPPITFLIPASFLSPPYMLCILCLSTALFPSGWSLNLVTSLFLFSHFHITIHASRNVSSGLKRDRIISNILSFLNRGARPLCSSTFTSMLVLSPLLNVGYFMTSYVYTIITSDPFSSFFPA